MLSAVHCKDALLENLGLSKKDRQKVKEIEQEKVKTFVFYRAVNKKRQFLNGTKNPQDFEILNKDG